MSGIKSKTLAALDEPEAYGPSAAACTRLLPFRYRPLDSAFVRQ